MNPLNPCPCGQVPERLIVSDDDVDGCAYVWGSCCGQWKIVFYAGEDGVNSPECMALAREAWNAAPRGEMP